MIKRISLLTKKPGLSDEAFRRHWLEIHGPMARSIPGVRRYVQDHIVGTSQVHHLPSGGQGVDGFAEFWFDDREALDKAFAGPEGKELFADGALFIENITTFIVEEHTIIPDEATAR